MIKLWLKLSKILALAKSYISNILCTLHVIKFIENEQLNVVYIEKVLTLPYNIPTY